MERVIERGEGRPLALVDYAHTPDALGLVLDAVRPVTPGRVIVVFGAGGDRDRGKRVLMGEAAGRHADIVIVTDDNPRSEDPAAIRGEIVAGARVPGARAVRIDEVADRTEAISLALGLAQEDDTIVVAGKGHEVTQEIGGVTHAFSDQEALRATVRRERPERLA
ncbi:UDP-N-acetylmuramoyl-L-alanyl-D-glutamate--2,6-diaminopimelate ligase [mine drainage metagenome]|uniref:UDP-N-acetylmuramoyl-L-alanyl-D-glutamate--2, 6-diaminopimelate ligase n=1 Tax=mine drainage metagenome TaxID=410659 RepID=A0A1J5QZ90_9ZZZZ